MPTHRIGTSGWSYDHWTGPFYPEALPSRDRLGEYARTFNGAEINNTFYTLPSSDTLASWRDAVPEDFCFAVKASRYITHMKKLKDPEAGLAPLLERTTVLGPKRGPLLFQLPPRWRFNRDRLERFLEALGDAGRCAFEFRDLSWINDEALSLLERFDAAFCVYDLDGYRTPRYLTADFAYVRLHGPNGPYQGCYTDELLAEWADTLNGWAERGLDTYCWLDNDQAGYAPQNAQALARRLGLQPTNGDREQRAPG
jgi:uncharacterized protein YecE (DUF72 family)